jgi:hypothetical protein
MSGSLLEYLCAENAKKGRYLYQADEGGRIMINWEHAEGHEHTTHHNSNSYPSDSVEGLTVENTHFDVDEHGGHEHTEHAQTDEVTHLHEKGEHQQEHHHNHQHPAST